jgi:ABC-type sugar transport system ATPase subunit
VAESAATALATQGRRFGDGLTVTGLSKAFGDVQALDDVHLTVPRGEVTVVVGESGAGKTTLVRCLAGDLAPDTGTLTVDGRPLGVSPAAVQAQGVAIVWQDLAVCEELDAVSNLFLGDERGRVWLTESAMAVQARALLDELRLDVPHLRRPLRLLPTGQQQQIAIAGALRRKPRLLVLDELTTGLEAAQAATVVQLARRAAQQQVAVLLVTHAVDRVFAVADRIVVLRHGQVVAELRPAESHPDDVMALMSGVEVESTARRQLRHLQSLVDQLSEVTHRRVAAADRVGDGGGAGPGKPVRAPAGSLGIHFRAAALGRRGHATRVAGAQLGAAGRQRGRLGRPCRRNRRGGRGGGRPYASGVGAVP